MQSNHRYTIRGHESMSPIWYQSKPRTWLSVSD